MYSLIEISVSGIRFFLCEMNKLTYAVIQNKPKLLEITF